MTDNIDNDISDLMLEDPIGLSDLMNGGTKFTLRSNYQEQNEDDDLFPELETGEEGHTFDSEDFVSPWNKPFAELIPSMEDIGNQIYKKVVKQPVDKECIQGRCRVTISYNAFMENETCAFDSTFMRGSHLTFVTYNYEILPGLELAVMSMKRKEESQFIIPYDLLFGKLGCAPRIKAEADALFVIQLINFSEIGNEDATEGVYNEDKRKFSFMIDKILEVKASAIDHFRQGAYVKAAAAFNRAIVRLENCNLSNEAEENEQRDHLIKLYTNAMTCYNKMDKPKQACLAFKDLSRLIDTNKNPKALFQHGKALMSLGEYNAAVGAFKKAKYLKPDDPDIIAQMRILNEKHSKHKEMETKLWRKAMGNDEPVFSEKPFEISEKFKKTVSDLVMNFQNKPKKSKINIPDGLTKDEVAFIKDFIKDLNMKLVISEVQGKKNCYLTKTPSFK